MARPAATTTTDVRLPLSEYSHDRAFVCHDDEGHLYLTACGHRCVYKVHWQQGRYAAATVLAGLPGDAKRGEPVDGDGGSTRFEDPFCLCLHPLDHSRLLVTDGRHLRSVDVVSGDTTTLALKGRRPVDLLTCASGNGPHVWIADTSVEGDEEHFDLLRLDMRSLEVEVVLRERISVLFQDAAGDAICTLGPLNQLWRVRPDGSKTLLAGTEEAGYRDGPAGQAQLDADLRAAAAGDGSIVVSELDGRRLRLVSPDGTVSTLAGSGDEGTQDGPPAAAAFRRPCAVAVAPHGHIVVLDRGELQGDSGDRRLLLRTVPTQLPPPVHLQAARAVPHPLVAMCGDLLRSGLLADATIRVVVAAAQGRQGQADVEAAAAPGPSRRGSSGCAGPACVDIPCHRAILAAGCPYFEALFAGPLAPQHAPPSSSAGAAAGRRRSAGRKRKAAPDDAPATDDAAAAGAGGAAAAAAGPSAVVVTVDDASEDAVRAVLRYMYSGRGDLGGVTATTAQDVLHLAQRWGLDGLLEACQAYVAEQLLGPGNAAEWLMCAHLRQYGALRRAALRAVVEHFAAVRDDPAQAALLKGHPDVLMDVTATASGAAVQ